MSRRFYVSLASLTLFLVCVSQWDRATASEEKEHTSHTLPLRLHNQSVQRRSKSHAQVPPLAASASNPDNKHLDGTKSTLPAGTTSYSSETKPLLDRSTIQVKKIPSLEMKTLILEQQFSNDVHYKVEGDLSLTRCTGLTALPENLSVGGDLSLRGCTGLTALPEDLSVGGNLYLRNCTCLAALPENLSVRGNLSLDGCTGLAALPENLSVGSFFYLLNCTGLTALPNGIAMLGSTSQGYTRHVYLENTGLSDALIDRLRTVEAPGMRFYFSRNAGQPEQQFLNMEQALAFWRNLAPSSAETPVPPLRPDQAADLIHFLGRLTGTADYQNQVSRPVLAQRVIDVMALLAGSVRVRDDALVRIHHAISTCDDRVILALDDLETLQLLTSAETMAARNSNPCELRALGLKMMWLDEVKRIAHDHMKTLNWVDEIEVELAFQIGVRKHLDLPGSTQNMIFRRCAHVSEQDIAKAVEQLKKNCSEAHLNVYLDRWAPWQKYQRHQAMPTFTQLKSKTVARINDCTICGEKTNSMVALGDCHLDYDALRKAYLENGKNPLTNMPMDWSSVARLKEQKRGQVHLPANYPRKKMRKK